LFDGGGEEGGAEVAEVVEDAVDICCGHFRVKIRDAIGCLVTFIVENTISGPAIASTARDDSPVHGSPHGLREIFGVEMHMPHRDTLEYAQWLRKHLHMGYSECVVDGMGDMWAFRRDDGLWERALLKGFVEVQGAGGNCMLTSACR
jgi:hypothetical protein